MTTAGDAGDWEPWASLEVIRARARLLSRIRAFFHGRGVLEVDTPIAATTSTTDPALCSMHTRYAGPGFAGGRTLYLQTSPEFFMKRLLCCGSGAIYQICKVFRDGERGRFHNPEFTMLEWYRPGFDEKELMTEVEALVADLVAPERLGGETERFSYRDVFLRFAGVDPHVASVEALRVVARECGIGSVEHLDLVARDAWLDLIMSHVIEPRLGRGRLTFVYDYPASQASLARVRPGDPPVAERFELYMAGVEIANGFHELADSDEQRCRFERDNEARLTRGLPAMPFDERFLAALEAGLPDCSGVALGVDRLLMVAENLSSVSEVIAFPLEAV